MNELSEKWRALGLPWMPGMLDTRGRRVIRCSHIWVDWADMASVATWDVEQWYADAVPDWDDPATIGCLLQMVRDVNVHIDAIVIVWALRKRRRLGRESRLAEVLIAALEAAQGGRGE